MGANANAARARHTELGSGFLIRILTTPCAPPHRAGRKQRRGRCEHGAPSVTLVVRFHEIARRVWNILVSCGAAPLTGRRMQYSKLDDGGDMRTSQRALTLVDYNKSAVTNDAVAMLATGSALSANPRIGIPARRSSTAELARRKYRDRVSCWFLVADLLRFGISFKTYQIGRRITQSRRRRCCRRRSRRYRTQTAVELRLLWLRPSRTGTRST